MSGRHGAGLKAPDRAAETLHLGADGKRTAKAFSGSPPGMVQSRPSHPFQLSLRPLLPLPPYRNRLFQANGLLERAGRARLSVFKPPSYRKSSTGSAHRLMKPEPSPASPARISAAQARSVPSPASFAFSFAITKCTCLLAPRRRVPAHRETLSSHALAGCAILGKLTSLGLGFFHDSEDLPPSPAPRFAARTKSRLTAGAAPASTKPGAGGALCSSRAPHRRARCLQPGGL